MPKKSGMPVFSDMSFKHTCIRSLFLFAPFIQAAPCLRRRRYSIFKVQALTHFYYFPFYGKCQGVSGVNNYKIKMNYYKKFSTIYNGAGET